MRRLSRASAALLSVALAAPLGAAPETEPPKDVGLMERTSARLAQIDVTVSGPKDVIAGLTAADFQVKLNDKLVPNVIVDALCGETGASRAAATPTPAAPPVAVTAASASAASAVPAERASTVTYLLYFDQPHLTQAGRRASIDAAREMMPKLMAGGNRAMLVSNANSLKVLVPLTEDRSKIDAALAAMIDDTNDFDPFAMTEENRLAEIMGEIGNRTDHAIALAKGYAREERSRQERDLNRLRMVVGRLAEVDPPKAVLYFADNMRSNAGEHTTSRSSRGSLLPTGTENRPPLRATCSSRRRRGRSLSTTSSTRPPRTASGSTRSRGRGWPGRRRSSRPRARGRARQTKNRVNMPTSRTRSSTIRGRRTPRPRS